MGLFTKRNFKLEQIPDLTNKVAIITGCNTGVSDISLLELLTHRINCRSARCLPWKWQEKAVKCECPDIENK